MDILELIKDNVELLIKLFEDPKSLTVVEIVTLIIVGVILVYFLVKGGLWLNKKQQQRRLQNDLHPYYSKKDVKLAVRYYVPTKMQNLPPSKEDELSKTFATATQELAIPFFLHKAFKARKEDDDQRFYLLLADSGMGKTTFMINLYLAYTRRLWGKPYKIKLVPLGHDKAWDEELGNVEVADAKNTILLLDAFDEDLAASKDHIARMNDIIDKTWAFRKVVITSRSQFFPNEKAVPFELQIPKVGGDKGYHTFHRMYLSPLNESDVKLYLRKKYKWWPSKKKRDAWQLIKSVPNLMVRPMLLNYIDDLLKVDRKFTHTYQVYEALIEQWILREAKRVKGREASQRFKKSLHEFSRLMALHLYDQFKASGRLSVTAEEVKGLSQDMPSLELSEMEMRSRSLLNRDATHNYKFAHKSVLEYFLAVEAGKSTVFRKKLDFTAMSAAKAFYAEILQEQCIEKLRLPPKSSKSEVATALLQSEDPALFTTDNRLETYQNLLLLDGSLDYIQQLMQYKEVNAQLMVEITGGVFKMRDEYEVKVDGFSMAKYPITVGVFAEFIRATQHQTDADKKGYSFIWDGKKVDEKKGVNWKCDQMGKPRDRSAYNHPVLHVSWHDAMAFCKWLSEWSGRNYRLPTEAEWEFAARGGRESQGYKYSGSNEVEEVAWYGKKPQIGTATVGSLKPNELGLYDMSGNVWEWCADWYDEDYYKHCQAQGLVENPKGPKSGADRVLRGGSWGDGANGSRVSGRGRYGPGNRLNDLGFRVVCSH